MLTAAGRARAQADYDATVTRLDKEFEACRYCKAARTRAEKAGKPGMCRAHHDQYRLAWVCSPLSETYWAT